MTITGRRKRDPTMRRMFVYSSARAEAAARACARKPDGSGDDLSRLTRGLGSCHYPAVTNVTVGLAAITRDRRVGDCLHAIAASRDQRPTLEWHFGQAAIDAAAAADGRYALVTNLDVQTVPANQALASYEDQPSIGERRRHGLKRAFAVPLKLLHANRNAAIFVVVCMTRLICFLAEVQLRLGLAPSVALEGFCTGLAIKPTASLIFTPSAICACGPAPMTAHPGYPSAAPARPARN